MPEPNSIRGYEVKKIADANGKIHITAVKNDAIVPIDKVELYMRGKASGDLDQLNKQLNVLRDERMSNQSTFDKNPAKRAE